jgi:hypothetical protein
VAHGALHQQIGVVGQLGVGMQEQQHIGRAGRRAGVHLRGPAARRDERQVGMGPCDGQRVVLAAAVHHHHARAALAKALQRTQPCRQRLGFVEHRHDDAQPRSHASASCVDRASSRHASACGSKPMAKVGLMTAK